jgi:hypothetical protein
LIVTAKLIGLPQRKTAMSAPTYSATPFTRPVHHWLDGKTLVNAYDFSGKTRQPRLTPQNSICVLTLQLKY